MCSIDEESRNFLKRLGGLGLDLQPSCYDNILADNVAANRGHRLYTILTF